MKIIRDSVLFLPNTRIDGEWLHVTALESEPSGSYGGKLEGFFFSLGVLRVVWIGYHGVEARLGEEVAHQRAGGLLGRGEP